MNPSHGAVHPSRLDGSNHAEKDTFLTINPSSTVMDVITMVESRVSRAAPCTLNTLRLLIVWLGLAVSVTSLVWQWSTETTPTPYWLHVLTIVTGIFSLLVNIPCFIWVLTKEGMAIRRRLRERRLEQHDHDRRVGALKYRLTEIKRRIKVIDEVKGIHRTTFSEDFPGIKGIQRHDSSHEIEKDEWRNLSYNPQLTVLENQLTEIEDDLTSTWNATFIQVGCQGVKLR